MPKGSKPNVAILISGSGSNLQAIIDDARADPDYPAHLALVISNKADAYGLQRAKKAGIPSVVIDHKSFANREAFDMALQQTLIEHDIDFVCLAGFMRLLTAGFVEKWPSRMINIHPSLLPAFKGGNAVKDAMAAGVKVTGCTVHFVTADMDSGPIIVQAAVPIYSQDTEDSLLERLHMAEHSSLPLALKLLTSGKIRINGNHVYISNDN